jgi:hypothetical protein
MAAHGRIGSAERLHAQGGPGRARCPLDTRGGRAGALRAAPFPIVTNVTLGRLPDVRRRHGNNARAGAGRRWEPMESLYLWKDHPALSLIVLWGASVVFLWAARPSMLTLLRGLGQFVTEGCEGIARWGELSAERLRKQTRGALLAAGRLEAQGKLEREFHHIDATFCERIGQYATLHRRLDDILVKLDADYRACAETPPEVPGWTAAVEAISRIPTPGDSNVQKVLESIRESSQDAERKALKAYRDDTSRRHKTLGAMAPTWKDVKTLTTRVCDAVSTCLESMKRIDGYVEDYEKLHRDHEEASRTLTYSATRLFVVSALVLGVAMGGAFINFQLIALPMSELVPAGARLGGIAVSMVSALVIVLMETALGIFIMDMLGITDLFPKLQGVPASRRRLILGLALTGLFFLAAVESSLAVLREQIASADSALKLSLAGEEAMLVEEASNSSIPVIGQAVLGFVLPWVLAMAAIPLEMLLDSSRHVLSTLLVLALAGVANVGRIAAHSAGALEKMLVSAYDVYISIPLMIERSVKARGARGGEAKS